LYVSTSGNDANAGTQSAPFRSIKQALSRLKPGNTLYIRGGTYYEVLESHNGTKFPSGTSWSTPVRIAAYNGEQVMLNGTISIGKASPPTQYLIFDRINIDATNYYDGISLNGGSHQIRFQNLEIKNPNYNGIILSDFDGGSTHNEFLNLNIHHTGRSSQGHGMYIGTSYNLVDGCDVHDNYKNGVSIYNGYNQSSNFNIVRNSQFRHNAVSFGHAGAINVGGDGNLISNNLVYGNYFGINVGSGSPRNTKVLDNTVRDNISIGILATGKNDTIKNNKVYGNYPDYDIRYATGLTLVK
jgi:hypothetical protein